MNRLLILLFLFLLISSPLFSQFGPINTLTECEICHPINNIFADLDGDDYPDVLSMSRNQNSTELSFHFLRNDNEGDFESPIKIENLEESSSIYVRAIDAIDIDYDNDIDILLSVSIDAVSFFLYLENDGTGRSFQKRTIFTDIQSITTHKVADFNEDGFLDIIAVIDEDYKIVWYQNDGVGNFAAPSEIYSGIRIENRNFQLKDLDRDNDLDIVFMSSNNEVYWKENLGSINFAEPTLLLRSRHNVSVQFEDIDGDQDLDLIESKYLRELVWYPNEGNTTFREKKVIAPDGMPVSAWTTLADFDKDGDIDFINGFSSPDTLYHYINDGLGNFDRQPIHPIGISLSEAYAKEDIDRDGDLDILIGSDRINKLSVLVNDGFNNFSSNLISNSDVNKPIHIQAKDLDSDNRLDVIATSQEDGTVVWYQNLGNERFSDQEVLFTLEDVKYIQIEDIDDDGDMDILAMTSTQNSAIIWYKNDGQNNFLSTQLVRDQISNAYSFGLADLDNDEDEDIVIVSNTGIEWLKNDGMGTFVLQDTLMSFTNGFERLTKISFVDFNQDDFIDILAESEYGSINIYVNNEGELFSSSRIASGGLGKWWPSSIFTDVDEDGDLDILSAYFFEPRILSKLVFFENDNGSFFREREIETFQGVDVSIHLMDIDRDLDQDILLVGKQEAEVVWYENKGAGTYSEAHTIVGDTPMGDISFALPADINNDGFEDIIFRSYWADQIGWIENLFSSPAISGVSFFDENENGLFDLEERIIPNIPVQLDPKALSGYTNANGVFRFYTTVGSYLLTTEVDSCWSLTTDSTYTVNAVADSTISRNFGFRLDSDYKHLTTRLNAAFTRCNTIVPFWLSVENDGCAITRGAYAIVLDELVNLESASIQADFVNGDTLFWRTNELFPNQMEQIKLELLVADERNLGEIIQLTTIAYLENEQEQLVPVSSDTYASVIRCAYDPNDKLVRPNRSNEYDKNYTLFDETMEYTIRFQNTGNDTAFTVVIRDQLDEDLDWTTFKPITASHNFETLRHKNGLVEFSFKNILLPDSTTNEPLSHGFVSYQIQAKSDITENTLIENTANIYFDANPPIVTNTTQNTLVSELPKTTSSHELPNLSSITFLPNPSNGLLQLKLSENSPVSQLEVRFYSLVGQQIAAFKGQREFDLSGLVNGVYVAEVRTKGRIVGREKVIIQQ
ncbi:MAG: FG-GAP-like repeat-containing protein [Bacteroidota bacterium]